MLCVLHSTLSTIETDSGLGKEFIIAQTQLDKVLYTAKDHTTAGRDRGASRSSDGHLDINFSVPGKPGTEGDAYP
jgi:hypothetical protein